MAKIPPTNKWCIIRSNELLRQLLRSKKDELRLSNRQIAEMAGLVPDHVRWFFAGRRTGITQFSVVKLANVLGYEIKLDISVKIPT